MYYNFIKYKIDYEDVFTQTFLINDKKTFKNPTGIRDQKKSEKVWIWDPPEPQKVFSLERGANFH